MGNLLTFSRRVKRSDLAALGIGFAMGATGLCLIYLAKITPWYSNADAFFAAYSYGDSDAFFAAREKYVTAKFRYADFGYILVVWGAVIGVLTLLSGQRGLRGYFDGTRRLTILVPAFLFGVVSLWLGLTFSIIQAQGRFMAPPWSDSIGIPLAVIPGEVAFLSGVWALFIFSPLLLRRSPAGLLRWRRSKLGLVGAAVLYAVPLLAAGSLVALFYAEGSWATSVAGFAFLWLLLNALSILGGAKHDRGAIP